MCIRRRWSSISVFGVAIGILAITGVLKAKGLTLTGAGATFPYPLYSKMFNEYNKITGVKVNYQAIGSGAGIRQLLSRTVDFGASDAYVSDAELKEFKSEIVHIPVVAGAVVLTYNLPGISHLRLSPGVLSDIFLGKITRWNDTAIQGLNPNLKLPGMKIVVVHRSDGSGTTFIFSDYLSKVSKEWKEKVGRGKALRWPVGLGGKGNPGVAGLIKQIPGAIGYVELTYALSNNMPVASVQNRSGKFIKPSVESVSKASEVALPQDMRVSLTNTNAPYGYPISGFTWILVYRNLADGNLTITKAEELWKLLWWMTHNGQKFAKPLYYAPLSQKALKMTEKLLNSLNYNGKPLVQ